MLVKMIISENGAQEKTRTSTTLRPLAPEASASTNSATWASGVFPANILRRDSRYPQAIAVVNTIGIFRG